MGKAVTRLIDLNPVQDGACALRADLQTGRGQSPWGGCVSVSPGAWEPKVRFRRWDAERETSAKRLPTTPSGWGVNGDFLVAATVVCSEEAMQCTAGRVLVGHVLCSCRCGHTTWACDCGAVNAKSATRRTRLLCQSIRTETCSRRGRGVVNSATVFLCGAGAPTARRYKSPGRPVVRPPSAAGSGCESCCPKAATS